MNLVRTIPPADPLVSLVDLKAHLRIAPEVADFDTSINGLFASAMAHIDGPRGVLGRCIQPQTWEARPDPFSGYLRLPLPGIDTVQIFSEDGEGERTELSFTMRRSWPWTEVALDAASDGDLVISMRASTPDDCWPAIMEAVKLLVGHWRKHPEAVLTGTIATVLPIGVTRLLNPLKMTWI